MLDNIVDNSLSNTDDRKKTLKFYEELLLTGKINKDNALSLEALDKRTTIELKVLTTITKQLHNYISNSELTKEVSHYLSGFVLAELEHNKLPNIENSSKIGQIVLDLYSEIEEIDETFKNDISLKIAIGVGGFTLLALISFDYINIEKESDYNILKSLFCMSAAAQISDDIADRGQDLRYGKISFATKTQKSDMGKYKILKEMLYNKGILNLEDKRQKQAKLFKFFGELHAVINSKIKIF